MKRPVGLVPAALVIGGLLVPCGAAAQQYWFRHKMEGIRAVDGGTVYDRPSAAGAATQVTVSPSAALPGTIIVGQQFTAGFEATGGVAPYAWSLGSAPAGMGIDSQGFLSWTPANLGLYAGITVAAADAEGLSGTSDPFDLKVVLPAGVSKMHAAASTATGLGKSVSSDGATLAVGAPASGVVEVFRKSGAEWLHEATLPDPTPGSNGFGEAVAVDGDHLVVGAMSDGTKGADKGLIHVFQRTTSGWVRTASLFPSNAVAPGALWFGASVAISGTVVVAGAPLEETGGYASGAAFVFEGSGSSWSQTGKLTLPDAASGEYFGHAVAASGTRVVVGAWGDKNTGYPAGSASVFEQSSGWVYQTRFLAETDRPLLGVAVAVDGGRVIAAWAGSETHSRWPGAYVYEGSGTSWTKRATLLGDAAGDQNRNFVDVVGDRVVLGVSQDDKNGANAGAAFVFENSGGTWSRRRLGAPDAGAEDMFGHGVAIAGTTVAVGAPNDDDRGSNTGAVYLFD